MIFAAAGAVLSLPVALLQLAAGGGDQGFPQPVAQVAGALAADGMLSRFTDQGVVLREESDPEGGGMSTGFFDLWSSHGAESTPNGPTSQEGRFLDKSSSNPLTLVPNGSTLTDMVAQNKTAPEVASTTAGALTRPTGAELTSIGIMAPGRAFRKEPVDGMPSLSRTC